MRSIFILFFVVAFLALMLGSCKDDSTTEPQESTLACGDGQGYKVVFSRQVDHYEADYGVAGQDVITVSCLVGPQGATVSNATNGTYYCSGTYKLSTFQTARIDLNWGGSTSYSMRESFEITAKGTGTFKLKCTKISGGSGNMFLSMSSGSSWMFDTVLVND
ncbi:MAG: hypothetical protein ACRDGA_06185 [Bacteroidota bacterium]